MGKKSKHLVSCDAGDLDRQHCSTLILDMSKWHNRNCVIDTLSMVVIEYFWSCSNVLLPPEQAIKPFIKKEITKKSCILSFSFLVANVPIARCNFVDKLPYFACYSNKTLVTHSIIAGLEFVCKGSSKIQLSPAREFKALQFCTPGAIFHLSLLHTIDSLFT